MSQAVEFNESELLKILRYYQSEQDRLRSELTKLQGDIRENDSIIEKIKAKTASNGVTSARTQPPLFEQNSKGTTTPTGKYDPSLSFRKKAIFILTSIGHLLTVREVLNLIYQYEPGLKDKGDSRKDFGTLSSLMSTLATSQKGKVFCREKSNDGQYLYGLIEWQDRATGKIKAEYREQ